MPACSIADQHDVAVGRQDDADRFGEASLQADVDRAAQVTAGILGLVPAVQKNRPPQGVFADIVDVQQRRCISVQQRMLLTIAQRVELEVARSRGLVLGERGNELVGVDHLQRVVGAALLTDR